MTQLIMIPMLKGVSDSATSFTLNTILSAGRLKFVSIENGDTDNCIMSLRIQRASDSITDPAVNCYLISRGVALKGDALSWAGDLYVDGKWRLVALFQAPLAVGDDVNCIGFTETEP